MKKTTTPKPRTPSPLDSANWISESSAAQSQKQSTPPAAAKQAVAKDSLQRKQK